MMRQNSSLLLVLLILCVASSNSISAKVVDVDIICKEASNPSYCSNLLNSKPGGAKGVDLVDLARYTIDVLNNNSSDTLNLIHNLVRSAENDTVANYYYRCDIDLLNHADSVTSSLTDAQVSLSFRKYPAMAKDSADIMKYILECIDSLHKHKTSPLLATYVENLRQSAQVFQIITKYLNLEK
ncbi:plant invertase/pectin methylesterase inhibitor [Medicago truncatula]|uniref:Plant invertase/pectin methylesterase inhibitor n=1 Tax=Medicago truncatula TaxID=3880 RepID=A0A072U8Q0_MEDTR|nr:plant invertase/pectin methylesterase inhibitor [Medicago truncatula]KEH25474.1 plant invertase/pectin methylesterase inhibitor [Medicago truncatula]